MSSSQTIVDAHHHIWQLERTPWLNGPIVPRIFGDYAPLRRDYAIEEFAQDVAPHGVTKSVYVQVNVAPGDEIWEAQWAAEQGRRCGLIHAIVAFCDLASDTAEPTLEALAQVEAVRGIRQQLHWHRDPLYSFARRPAIFLDPQWQNGLRALSSHGMHFELQVFPSQFADALTLVDAFPTVRFILLHAGMLEDRSADGRSFWIEGLKRLAERDNVHVKLSATGTFTRRCDAAELETILRPTIDTFGPDRCIFGSNFPIEKLWTDYSSLMGAIHSALRPYSEEERHKILCVNAEQFYKI